ncbi:uncharacterized protein LOC133173600 [Saccostrea echinata]|uniref:uncharacterized protein LOC133173600 n=1 Tax=Saccostrea echinata TaxID=191078 RepID=UPI002A82E3B7|nr:uncharacterized protein LOC133173600 [Saccostrea echinata]
MPRAKTGTKRKSTDVSNRGTGSRAKTRKAQRVDDDGEHKEEVLVRKVTQAVLEVMDERNKTTDTTGGGASDSDDESDSEITFKEIEGSDDEYASSEAIDTFTWSTPISAMIPQKLKQKIWEDQYIDLAALLPDNLIPCTENNDYTFKLGKNTNISVVPKKAKQTINTIYQWTTAFLRFVSVYAEKFPNETPNLLKHAETVRDMASSGNVSWQTYDKQIRMDRQNRGTPWGKLNVEFILQAQRSREETKQPFRPFRSRFGQRFLGKNSTPEEFAGHIIGMGVANLKTANFNTFVQDVEKTTLKQIAEHKQLIEAKCSIPQAKQQNNNEVVTPIIPNVLQYLLLGYDATISDYLVSGFKYGFDLHYHGPRYFRASRNLSSALRNTVIVCNKLQKELDAHRIAGPFVSPPFENLQISPIGIVPKKEHGQFRLIHHLSFPEKKFYQ